MLRCIRYPERKDRVGPAQGFQDCCRKCEASSRSKAEEGWRCDVPGTHGGQAPEENSAGPALGDKLCPVAQGKDDEGESCRRVAGCLQQHRFFHKEKRRYSQDGGG